MPPSIPSKEGGKPYTIDLLFAIISAGFPFGWSMIGFPPNIIWGCCCWVLTLAAVLDFFMRWSHNTKKFKRTRWIVIIIVPVLVAAFSWRPIANQYRIQHPTAPELPQILLETINGYPFGAQPDPNLRWNNLSVRNSSDIDIYNLFCRIQLPEAIVETGPVNKMVGINTDWHPALVNPIITAGTASRGSNGGFSLGGHSSLELPYNYGQFNRPHKHGDIIELGFTETGGGTCDGDMGVKCGKTTIHPSGEH